MGDDDVVGDRLPGPVAEWIEQGPGGPIVGLERNASRREGWIVTVAGAGGPGSASCAWTGIRGST